MNAYSNDLRKRIIDAINDGDKVVDVAERFSVGVRFVYSLLRRFLDTGSYEAKKRSGGAPRKISHDDEIKIQQIIKKNPDATLEEIRKQADFKVSIATIHRAIKRMNITFKKNTLSSRAKFFKSTGLKKFMENFSSGLYYK